ncbi:MAG: leucine-rich repeat domain-containing protein [Aureliella sp.]
MTHDDPNTRQTSGVMIGRASIGCLLTSIFALGLVNTACFADERLPAEAMSALEAAEQTFAAKLDRIEQICIKLNLADEAAITRAWLPISRADRDVLYLTGADPVQAIAPGESESARNAKASWQRHFQAARQEFAEAVFKCAEQIARESEPAAYRLLWRVLRENPEHAESKRILGFLSKSPAAGNRLVRGKQPLRDLGWEAGEYSKIESPHFSILTHADAKTSREIARELETFYALWTQVFYSYWAKPGFLKAKFEGANRLWPRGDKSQILILRDRSEYTRVLGVSESNIGVSVGYYNPNVLKSAFYPGEGIDALRATLFHEITHQLVMEATQNETKANAGQQGGIWLIEGIALYMESLQEHTSGYWTLGGWDAPRMQTARYRAVRDGYWPHWQAFADGEVGAWKTDPEIARLYTHAYGLTQTLLHQSDESEQEFYRQLMSVYQGRNQSASLLSKVAESESAAKQAYPDSLIIQDSQIQDLLEDIRRGKTPPRELVLTGSDLSKDIWPKLAHLTDLQWLDISFSNVTDGDLPWLKNQQSLTRLSLEGTAITGESVKRAAALTKLKELDLSGCRLSSSDLQSLANHPSLEILWLTQSGVDAEILPILESITGLTTVDVSGTEISVEAWAEFVSANPRLKKD